MSIVSLVSGGLDSSLMAYLTAETGIVQYPLFINYGQLSYIREWDACQKQFAKLNLPNPVKIDVDGYGKVISSGITDPQKDIKKEAFLPGRNLFFLLLGASYAFKTNSDSVCIGLLNDSNHLFPDQSKEFLQLAEKLIQFSLGKEIKIIAPLDNFYKQDVVELARLKGISDTYSCHAGGEKPCGKCIACEEFIF